MTVFFVLFFTSWMLKFAQREVLERSTPSQSTRCFWAALDCKRRKKCMQSSVFKLWILERAAVVLDHRSKLVVWLLFTQNVKWSCLFLFSETTLSKEGIRGSKLEVTLEYSPLKTYEVSTRTDEQEFLEKYVKPTEESPGRAWQVHGENSPTMVTTILYLKVSNRKLGSLIKGKIQAVNENFSSKYNFAWLFQLYDMGKMFYKVVLKQTQTVLRASVC